MKLGEAQERFSILLATFTIWANGSGFGVRLREVQRTPEQQRLYYDAGKSKTLKSKHLESLAADIYFTYVDGSLIEDYETLKILGDYWEQLDDRCEWGGNWKWKDTPHFQYNR